MADVIFYLLSTVLLGAAFMAIRSPNTVYGVFFLILTFCAASGLLGLLQAEFFAFILLIVYVGAIAILFLFVVMMLGGGQRSLLRPFLHSPSPLYTLAMGILLLLLITALVLGVVTWHPSSETLGFSKKILSPLAYPSALGRLLYTHYVLPFQALGLIFLIAMMGAIVLTLRHRRDVRRQNISQQLKRNPRTSVRLVDLISSQTRESP